MVSIMPGMENTAPERTETSSGFSEPPSLRPVRSSSRARPALISSARPSGHSPSRFMVSTQAFVVTVKASGTGTPTRAISATPAPFPPSRLRMVASPSERS